MKLEGFLDGEVGRILRFLVLVQRNLPFNYRFVGKLGWKRRKVSLGEFGRCFGKGLGVFIWIYLGNGKSVHEIVCKAL